MSWGVWQVALGQTAPGNTGGCSFSCAAAFLLHLASQCLSNSCHHVCISPIPFNPTPPPDPTLGSAASAPTLHPHFCPATVRPGIGCNRLELVCNLGTVANEARRTSDLRSRYRHVGIDRQRHVSSALPSAFSFRVGPRPPHFTQLGSKKHRCLLDA